MLRSVGPPSSAASAAPPHASAWRRAAAEELRCAASTFDGARAQPRALRRRSSRGSSEACAAA
eukprot:2631968-Pyramimonas_sp.AAC.1